MMAVNEPAEIAASNFAAISKFLQRDSLASDDG